MILITNSPREHPKHRGGIAADFKTALITVTQISVVWKSAAINYKSLTGNL